MYLVKWTDGPGKVLTIDTNLHTLVIPWEDVQMAPTVLKPSNFLKNARYFELNHTFSIKADWANG